MTHFVSVVSSRQWHMLSMSVNYPDFRVAFRPFILVMKLLSGALQALQMLAELQLLLGPLD